MKKIIWRKLNCMNNNFSNRNLYLSHEGSEIFMLKVIGEHFIRKFIDVLYDKWLAVFIPAYDILVALILSSNSNHNYISHLCKQTQFTSIISYVRRRKAGTDILTFCTDVGFLFRSIVLIVEANKYLLVN